MDKQQTIAKDVTLSGRGLFSGIAVNVTFRPAADDQGIVFVRKDLDDAQIPAHVQYVVKRPRRSALRNGHAVVETCEHVMSALAGLGIDNAIVELDGPELPGLDGSSMPFVQAIQSAGIAHGQADRRTLVLREPVYLQRDDMTLAALPNDEPGLQIVYELDYSKAADRIPRQIYSYDSAKTDYVSQVASARTFVLEEEANALRAAGLGKHLTARDVLVIDAAGRPVDNAYRYDNEPVRHKVLDLIGDLFLMGARLQAKVIAVRSGHALNQALARELLKKLRHQQRESLAVNRHLMDIRQVMTMLPHRYPMLLVDRVLEIDADRRVLGVKNVSVNEPFFQGHFPVAPIMPGVLILEAMAQLSGVLMGQKIENRGRIAVLLSLDRVKLRKPVVPGDQLMLEAETVKMRSTLAHMRCRAYVGEELAAEAEIKFMIVDEKQI